MKKVTLPLFILLISVWQTAAFAAIHTETVEYKHGAAVLEGYLAYDDAVQGKRPGIVLVHDWMGVGPYAKSRAEQIAGLGYVAFAIDMYGKGIRPTDPKDAGAQASIYKSDRKLMRDRAEAGLKVLQSNPLTDPSRIAAIGYCFGGTTVLEMARSGADLKGVVSFHGGLDTPNPNDAKNIKGKVLILHGANDPYAPAKDVRAMEDEMKNAGVDWQLVLYGGAVHSFTNPGSGNDPSKGAAYNSQADKRSWEAMKLFLKEVLA